jgi:hypothetical protein
MWTAGELGIKSLTPMLMPVTVMHDPRTAVGAIADVALRTPDKDKVPRSKIDTALALWAHRFPDVVEEAKHNHEHGTLMQSMECLAPTTTAACAAWVSSSCQGGAEQANWCAHLKGEGDVTAARILRSVTFTGTGLIFGSRNARGADPKAHLETFQQEVAEFHQRVHRDTPGPGESARWKPSRSPSPSTTSCARPESSELDGVARAEKAEKDLEAAETAKVGRGEKAELQKKVDAAEEKANQTTLRDERIDGARRGLHRRARREDQGAPARRPASSPTTTGPRGSRSSRSSPARSATSASPTTPADDGTFTADEVARFQGAAAAERDPTPNQRRSVFAGI